MIKKGIKEEENASNIITILQEEGKIREAEEFISTLSSDMKKDIRVRSAMTFIKLGKRDFLNASSEYSKLCKDQSDQAFNWLNYCASERGLKNSYKALRIVKMGLSIHPDNKKLRNALMQCLTEVGKLQSAKIVLSDILNAKEEISDQLMFDIQSLEKAISCLTVKC